MKKRELIYLHGLVAEVRRFLDAHEELPAEPFDRYAEYGVAPTAIHRSKAEHKEAVMRLLDGVTTALEARRTTDDDAAGISTEQ